MTVSVTGRDADHAAEDCSICDPEDPEPPGLLTIDWIIEAGDWAVFEPLAGLVEDATKALSAHPDIRKHLPAEATIAFDADAAVRDLNHRYRGLDKPTNVLSFPSASGTAGGPAGTYIGDIVMAAQTVRREASELGISPRHHLLHLVVHGVLHLMGYDHETDSEAAVMENLETAILATLGIADPYSEAPA